MSGSEPVRFLILFEGRTGSSFLVGCLAAHPEIAAGDEILDRFVGFRSALDERNRDPRHERQAAPDLQVYPRVERAAELQIELTRSTLTAPDDPAARAVGFKTKLTSILDPDGFTRTLRELNVRIVHMRRRNVVKQVVSSLNSGRIFKATGNWNLLDEKDRLGAFRIEPALFATKLAQRVETERRLDDYVAALAAPTSAVPLLALLQVDYEEILLDRQRFFGRVLDFLGVACRPLPPPTRKNTDDDLRNVLANFDELHARFDGTPYGAMFDEVLASGITA